MRYGQDFDSNWKLLPFSWVCIIGCYIGLQCLMKMDKTEEMVIKRVEVGRTWKAIGIGISGVCIYLTCGGDWAFSLLLSLVAACLLIACVMDMETTLIYNYVWWIGGGAGVLLLLLSGSNRWLSIGLFILLQELLFSKMYGRADCHGFVVCALVEGAYDMGMKEYLLHMLLAFSILGLIQLFKHNVGRNGNLKKPVPFLPYMTIAFWIMLLIHLLTHLCV